jgi:hypothetical protein
VGPSHEERLDSLGHVRSNRRGIRPRPLGNRKTAGKTSAAEGTLKLSGVRGDVRLPKKSSVAIVLQFAALMRYWPSW